MTVQISSAQANMLFSIHGADGYVLKSVEWQSIPDGCGFNCAGCGVKESHKAFFGYWVRIEYACGMLPADSPQYHRTAVIFVSFLGTVHAQAAVAPTKRTTEGFAIYLPAQKIAANEILKANLDGLELADEPILSVDDIVTYSKDTHEIELTPAAYQRIRQLKLPTTGLPFVVCVDHQPVYAGAFWVSYSSVSFEGVVVDLLFAERNHRIRIQLGYPESPELFVGEDRRSDAKILQSLEQAGKLR